MGLQTTFNMNNLALSWIALHSISGINMGSSNEGFELIRDAMLNYAKDDMGLTISGISVP